MIIYKQLFVEMIIGEKDFADEEDPLQQVYLTWVTKPLTSGCSSLRQEMQTGNHTLYSCKVEKIYGDESRPALFAWNGYSVIAPAEEGK